MQQTLLSCAIRDVLAVPRGSPQALTSPLSSPPELLALPIALGGFAFPLFVARKLLRQGGVEQPRLGPAIYIPCLEGFLAAAVSENLQLVPRSSSPASLAGSWRCGTPQMPQRPRAPGTAHHRHPYSASPKKRPPTLRSERSPWLHARCRKPTSPSLPEWTAAPASLSLVGDGPPRPRSWHRPPPPRTWP